MFKHQGTRRKSSPPCLWGQRTSEPRDTGQGNAGSHLVDETGKLVVEVLDLLLLVGPHLALLGVHAHAQGLEELGVDADTANPLRPPSAEADADAGAVAPHGHSIPQASVAAQAPEAGTVPKAHHGAKTASAVGHTAAPDAGVAVNAAAAAPAEGNPLASAQVADAAAAEAADPTPPSHGLAHGGRAAVDPAQAADGGGRGEASSSQDGARGVALSAHGGGWGGRATRRSETGGRTGRRRSPLAPLRQSPSPYIHFRRCLRCKNLIYPLGLACLAARNGFQHFKPTANTSISYEIMWKLK